MVMLINNFLFKIKKYNLLFYLGIYCCFLGGCKENTNKYSDIFGAHHDYCSFFDYEEALVAAQKSDKPILIIFGGWGVVNSIRFEKEIVSKKEIISFIRQNFILLNLYVDDRTILPESEWVKARGSSRMVKTLGVKNGYLEFEKFNRSSQPYWGVLDTKGNVIVEKNTHYLDSKGFLSFLKKANNNFIKQK